MLYDPVEDAPKLREALKKLAAVEHISAQSVLDMFEEAKPSGSRLSLSLATLQRFIGGEDITKVRELRAIWKLLDEQRDYRQYLMNGSAAAAPADNFGAALTSFFASPGSQTRLATALECFPGVYLMMRRDMDLYNREPDGVRASKLTITREGDSLKVEEQQDYQQRGDDMGHRQQDAGYMFVYGKYLHFLLREQDGSGVKHGVVKFHNPERGSLVQMFEGALYVASNRATFPRARFFCRRWAAGDAIPSGYGRLGDITDADARGYIGKDFKSAS